MRPVGWGAAAWVLLPLLAAAARGQSYWGQLDPSFASDGVAWEVQPAALCRPYALAVQPDNTVNNCGTDQRLFAARFLAQ
jgi:hypothetical protein